MIKTVAVKNLLFHFHNDLLFFEIHSLDSKRNKKSLCSRTFYAPLQYYPMQNSFQIILLFKSSVDPKKEKYKGYFSLLSLLTSFGENIKYNFCISKWEVLAHEVNVHCPEGLSSDEAHVYIQIRNLSPGIF